MRLQGPSQRLTIFIGETDQYHHKPLYSEIRIGADGCLDTGPARRLDDTGSTRRGGGRGGAEADR